MAELSRKLRLSIAGVSLSVKRGEKMVPRCFEWVTLDYLFKKVIVDFLL